MRLQFAEHPAPTSSRCAHADAVGCPASSSKCDGQGHFGAPRSPFWSATLTTPDTASRPRAISSAIVDLIRAMVGAYSRGCRETCITTCIIAHQRWRALTSAELAKSPCFQRSRALTSARLISDKREVGSSSLHRPTDGNRCPYCAYALWGLHIFCMSGPPPMLSLIQEKAVIITGIRAGTASDCYACAVGRTIPTED